MVLWVIRSILHGGLIEPYLVTSQCTTGVCYPVWDDAYKRTLAANQKD